MEIIGNRKLWTLLTIIIFVSVEFSIAQYNHNPGKDSLPSDYAVGVHPSFARQYEIASLNGSVKTPAGVLRYIPVVVDNTQNQSTQVPFNLEVKIDSYALRSIESPSLGNVVWFSLNGSIIPSWIQANASSSSNCTIYWLKLNFPIPPDFSTTIFIGFDNTSVTNFINSTGLEGEAPQLSNIYGEYDNGNLIFPFYSNFSGSTLPCPWESGCGYSGHVAVNNGLIINESHNCTVAYANTNVPISQDEIFESLVTCYKESGGYPLIEGIGISTSKLLQYLKFNNSHPVDYYYSNGFEADIYKNNSEINELIPEANGTNISNGVNFTGKPFMVGISWSGPSTQYWYINDSTVLITNDSSIKTGPLYLSAGMTSGGNCSAILKIQYIRGRSMPPNNVMPLTAGQDVVSDLGCLNLTVSGIPLGLTWYLNVTGSHTLIENSSLSKCIEMQPGNYNYNVSAEYHGSRLSGSGTFSVDENQRTIILVVFVLKNKVVVQNLSTVILPPEIYLMIGEVFVLLTGFIIITIRNRRNIVARSSPGK